MKHLFILNPAAGKRDRTAEFTEIIDRTCAPLGLDYAIRVSSCAGDCAALAEKAAKTGEELRIYACGGDGTLNEVVSGTVGFPNVAVTHFPGGSGNDFIRIFGRTEPFSDLSALLDPAESTLDLIDVNGERTAVGVCSMGIDARIGTEVARYKRIPGVSGSGAYNLSLVINLLRGIRRPFELELDGKTIRGDLSLVCICNGRYYGGGYCPVPDAQPDDGLLDVLVVRGVGPVRFARLVGRYKSGRYRDLPEDITHYRVKSLTVRSPKESVVNLDGEAYYAREVRFSVSPHRLRFFYPKSVFFREKSGETERKEEFSLAQT